MSAIRIGVVTTTFLAANLSAAVMGFASPAAAASADHISVNTGAGWSQQPTAPLFDFVGMGPGYKSSSSLAVRNDSTQTASLMLSATDIIDDENGCNRPESLVDTTCSGNDVGELGREMVITVCSQADPQTALWSGSLYDLTNGASLESSVTPNQVNDFIITAELPFGAGNETQTDRVSFNLELTLDGASVAVQGTKVTRQSGSGPFHHVLAELPLTGTPAERLAAAALSLLIAGAALVLAGTRRRRKGTF